MPGMGWGYLPSLLAVTGAGESMVNLSTPGANSWSQLSMSSKVISWPVWAAMRPMLRDEAGFDAALDFVVGLVVADGVDQVVPFVLIGILLALDGFGLPEHI